MPQPTVDSQLAKIHRDAEEQRTQAIAVKLGMAYVNLGSLPIPGDVLRLVDPALASQHHLVAYQKDGDTLRLATSRPSDPALASLLSQLQDATGGLKIQLTLASEASIESVLNLYATTQIATEAPQEVTLSSGTAADWQAQIQSFADLKNRISSTPATELLDTVFAGALTTASSDIHLEPGDKAMRIRFRIDGVLQTIGTLQPEAYRTLLSRIKYLAKLKLDVSSIPQDGRFSGSALGKDFDVRVSLIPGPKGEFVVMRLLYHDQMLLSLDKLGIRPDALAKIQEAMTKPHGIIFNTGPTGSGKTTTLYAILNDLNQPTRKIITLEDPIEYKIDGIDQTEIDTTKDYTFAKGLRAILRQDPDIILVGEVRDAETANTAIQAALTGHLVLTTLHTNSAAAALPRLIDMGVPPYLLAGAVNLIIAQRLVRRVCATCHGTGIDPTRAPQPCPTCAGMRYKGRLAIIEVLVPDETMNTLIAEKAPLAQFEQAARSGGMITMQADGMMKVKQGLTTIEEINRVTEE